MNLFCDFKSISNASLYTNILGKTADFSVRIFYKCNLFKQSRFVNVKML